MGSFWSNLSLRTSERSSLHSTLREAKLLPAYLCSATPGWLTVYSSKTEDQQEETLEEASCVLTRALDCAGIATLMHDDDSFLYLLANRGELIDRYESSPGMLRGEETPPCGGDAQLLVQTLKLDQRYESISRILRPSPSTFRASGLSATAAAWLEDFTRRKPTIRAEGIALRRAQGMSEEDASRLADDRIATIERQYLETQAHLGVSFDFSPKVQALDVASALERALGLPEPQLQMGFKYVPDAEDLLSFELYK